MSTYEEGEALEYIDIMVLEDGEYRPRARVWDDGRFDASPGWARTLMAHRLYDQVTGTRQARGPGLIRAVERSFNNGYVATCRGSAMRCGTPAQLLPTTQARRD